MFQTWVIILETIHKYNNISTMPLTYTQLILNKQRVPWRNKRTRGINTISRLRQPHATHHVTRPSNQSDIMTMATSPLSGTSIVCGLYPSKIARTCILSRHIPVSWNSPFWSVTALWLHSRPITNIRTALMAAEVVLSVTLPFTTSPVHRQREHSLSSLPPSGHSREQSVIIQIVDAMVI